MLLNYIRSIMLVFMGKDYKDRVSCHSDRQSHGFVYFKSIDSVYTFINGRSVHVSSGDFLYLPKYSSYSFKPKFMEKFIASIFNAMMMFSEKASLMINPLRFD